MEGKIQAVSLAIVKDCMNIPAVRDNTEENALALEAFKIINAIAPVWTFIVRRDVNAIY